MVILYVEHCRSLLWLTYQQLYYVYKNNTAYFLMIFRERTKFSQIPQNAVSIQTFYWFILVIVILKKCISNYMYSWVNFDSYNVVLQINNFKIIFSFIIKMSLSARSCLLELIHSNSKLTNIFLSQNHSNIIFSSQSFISQINRR